MKIILDSTAKNTVKGMKMNIQRRLENEFFDLTLISNQPKEWKKFQNLLSTEALGLIKEINRTQQNYSRIYEEDLSSVYEQDGTYCYFDFSGGNGFVRFIFKKGRNNVIHLEDIKEEVYEEMSSLF